MDNPDALNELQRQKILSECFMQMKLFQPVRAAYEAADDLEAEAMKPEVDRFMERIIELRTAYHDGLPILAMSRCPFTGEEWRHSFDAFGLDGFWWDAYKPLRPFFEPLGGKYWCFTGAVKLAESIEYAPFLRMPGPEAPFVIPNILDHPSILAVISSHPIGGHRGYPVVYFVQNEPLEDEYPRANDWGLTFYTHWDKKGNPQRGEATHLIQDYDFDLEHWVRSGKLLWIGPGDKDLRLQKGVSGCPYLNLPGKRLKAEINENEVSFYE